jgi:hypothetical protein
MSNASGEAAISGHADQGQRQVNEQAGHDARRREQAAASAAPEAGAHDEHRVGAGSQGQQERRGQEERVELRVDDHGRGPDARSALGPSSLRTTATT